MWSMWDTSFTFVLNSDRSFFWYEGEKRNAVCTKASFEKKTASKTMTTIKTWLLVFTVLRCSVEIQYVNP